MTNNNEENNKGTAGPDFYAGKPKGPRPETPKSGTPASGSRPGGEEKRPAAWDRSPMAVREQRLSRIWLSILAMGVTIAICFGIAAIYQSRFLDRQNLKDMARGRVAYENTEGKVAIRVFYPSPEGLVPEDRWVEPSEVQIRTVENAVREYLNGPSKGAVSYVPEGTKLLGLYRGSDGIIYMDLSHEFRSSFQGDAYGEYLLLRGLYESVMSNAKDVSALKVLIEGEEVDTIGGHISLEGTLGSVVSSTVLEGYEGK